MELSQLLTQQLVSSRLAPKFEAKEAIVSESSKEEQSIEEMKIAPDKGGILDNLKGNISGDGVGQLTDIARKKDAGGILDNLKGNTSGVGVGSFTAMGAGYDGLKFAQRGR